MEDQPRQQRGDPRRKRVYRNILVGVAVSFGILFVVALAWPALQSALQWYLGPPKADLSVTDRKDLVQGLASAGQALAVLFTGVVALVGLYFTRRNTDRQLAEARESTDKQLRQARESQERNQESVQETLRLTEQGQITERFTRAIEQLGSDKLEIRLGGIYALERIAVDSLTIETSSGRDYATVMAVLTAYVREENSHWIAKTSVNAKSSASDEMGSDRATDGIREVRRSATQTPRKTPPDIRAILDIIRRRKENPIQLNFNRAHLYRARLDKANLVGATFYKAYLYKAHLERAVLRGAELRKAILSRADLRGADLEEADLRGADLTDAKVTKEQLATARSLKGATMPDGSKHA